MGPSKAFKGSMALLISLALALIGVISSFVCASYGSTYLAIFIVTFATVGGQLIAPIVLWILDKAYPQADEWFKRSDASLEEMFKVWPRFGKRKLISIQISQPVVRFLAGCLLLTSVIVLFISFPVLPQAIHNLVAPNITRGIYVNEQTHIGISDGQYHFWQDANTDNAETLIYQMDNDLKSLSYLTSSPHVTMVVVTTLDQNGRHTGSGHDDLQGAAVLQREANDNEDSCAFVDETNCLRLRLLVANAGDNLEYSTLIAQQVIQIAAEDPTFGGVIGWPLSTSAGIEGLHMLLQHHIVVISSTASSDALTASSPFFFRVAPVDSEQGPLDAKYVEQNYAAAHNAVVFYAKDNPYSQTLASSFIHEFTAQSTSHVIFETYNSQDSSNLRDSSISQDVKAAFSGSLQPDLIYFAGYAEDLSKLQSALQYIGSHIPVVSGDDSYDTKGYKGKGYQNITFTTFSSPDEWGKYTNPCQIAGNVPGVVSRFFCNYKKDFDPNDKHINDKPSNQYGFRLPESDVILTYDATNVLIRAFLNTHKDQPTQDDIQHALQGFNFCHPIQGVSGAIAFAPDGNPINKAIVLIKVDADGNTQYVGLLQGELNATEQSGC